MYQLPSDPACTIKHAHGNHTFQPSVLTVKVHLLSAHFHLSHLSHLSQRMISFRDYRIAPGVPPANVKLKIEKIRECSIK
ncbi:hypothetical protein RvY_13147 [Ramazzottius varieornatus]|uniref:Uncharacterized protein n=1 Tax=Ramazzottius varieornatus TaxID=947166 RepID=A0A1D1VP48_RAMVA|nr:hypothetical protein RvY_13147 [Ramazzottius varieornatus]